MWKKRRGYYPRSGSSLLLLWLGDGGGLVSRGIGDVWAWRRRVSCRRRGFTIEGEIMGIPIRVKETAAVSTYSYALPAKWKASTAGGGGGGGGREAERALRVLLTQMISRLDIQRGIL